MLKKLSVEDFAVLKGPFESGRQSPSSLGGTLVLAVIFQSLMFYLTYYIATRSTIYPNIEMIKKVHFWITAFLVLLSVIYAIPAIYMRSQKLQYLLSIIVSQNLFGIYMYIPSLFTVGEGQNVTRESLLNFTYITLAFGVLIFIVTSIRFYILLQKGQYRKGSKKDEIRGNIEKKIKSNFLTIIIGSVGLAFIIQYIVRTLGSDDFEGMFLIVIGFSIFFTMLFVLPEQLVILYCKCRFKSFNFNSRGYLESEDQDRKNDKKWDKKFVH